MPVKPTYPGVYIQEIPSGVHTITGVATSITAFVGLAKSGPVNNAVHILSFADYELNFGGLVSYSPMSYAVQQFFLNGGSEAWIVRVIAQSGSTGKITLSSKGTATTAKSVLEVSALYRGSSDRVTNVFIDSGTTTNTFKLIVVNTPPQSTTTTKPGPTNLLPDVVVETFDNLVMDRKSPDYVVTQVNSLSKLVTVTDLVKDDTTFPAPSTGSRGTLTSEDITDITALPKPTSKSFRIILDENAPNTITPIPPNNASNFANIDDAAAAITNAVKALKPADPAYSGFVCSVDSGKKKLILASGSYGPNSSVHVQALTGDKMAEDLNLTNGTSVPATPSDLKGGENGTTELATDEEFDLFIGDPAKFEGIYALDKVDLFNLLCLPGITDPKILNQADPYCQKRRAFLIADIQKGLTPNDVYNAITATTAGEIIPKTTYGAIYYPWVELADPLDNGNIKSFPPSGTIAGLYASTDTSRGVWKAPAGTAAALLGVQGLEYQLNDGENGFLNQQGVNCLRVFPAYGPVSWGARTLLGSDDAGSEYKYIPVRRTALFIEESLFRGLKWAVFEPNDEPLWAQIRLNVGAFMHTLFRKGAFQGQTPKDAYFVKCDHETTTQDDINQGIVNVVVGFAPLKPAEFVIVSLQQIAGQLQV